ncbi:MAG: peptidylprolyl isomerase [Gemmatimonadetes bacterium]|nr:peptidylprolyl isomerase [Gemmatimonadota bacterium]MDA1103446.1 peptidylprolyl isomerase [Gemmatimonadota bacterium]
MTSRSKERLIIALLLPLLGSACRGADDDAVPPTVRSPLLQPQRYAETAPPTFMVHLETTAGDVTIRVDRAWAPLGADRFYNLAKGGFYDDSRIYRVLPGFMAQFGLNSDPYVSQAWKTQFLVDDPVVESNTRGRVAFAKGGLHTRTTEIFISYKDNRALDGEGFAPIGEVVEGMDIVDAFYSGYGDGPPRGDGPYQAMAAARGNEYLDADFPELTRIVRATVTPQA